MQTATKFAIQVIYNGVTRPLEVEPHESVTSVLQRAIALFGVTQQPHLLSLFRADGTRVEEQQSAIEAKLAADVALLLRPDSVKGGRYRS